MSPEDERALRVAHYALQAERAAEQAVVTEAETITRAAADERTSR